MPPIFGVVCTIGMCGPNVAGHAWVNAPLSSKSICMPSIVLSTGFPISARVAFMRHSSASSPSRGFGPMRRC
eukprot:11578598-Heterocapsa_arctica.AAC.1